MLKWIGRFLLAGWFVGMVVLAVRGMPVQGQTPTEATEFLPLMSRQAPLTSDPLLRNYVALMVANGDESDPDYEIYTVRGDGSEPHRLTDNTVDDTGAVWSADGAKIAFVQRTGASPAPAQAMMINADGSEPQVLLDGLRGDNITLKWAPGKRQLLIHLHNEHPNFRSRLFLVIPNGTVRTLFDSTTALLGQFWEWQWGWSPDSNFVYYDTAQQLHVYSIATEETVMVAEGVDVGGSTSQIVWLPDSSALLYKVGSTNAPNGKGYVVRPDGSDTRELFEGPYGILGLLQGGRSLLLKGSSSGLSLFTISVAGSEVTPFSDGDVWFGGINPTGSEVFYWSHTDGKLWLHPVDGEPREMGTPQCRPRASFCALNSNTIWAVDGSKIAYQISEQEFRYDTAALWVLSLTPTVTHKFVERSQYGVSMEYLPSSPIWVGLNAYAYPYPNSGAGVLNSNDLSTIPLSVAEGRSQWVKEWRYMP